MVDADTVGTDESTTPQTRHWLVNGVKLQAGAGGGSPYTINYEGATSVYVFLPLHCPSCLLDIVVPARRGPRYLSAPDTLTD